MFFKKNKQNKVQEVLILTNFEDCEGTFFCENPNDHQTKSHVLSPLCMMDENNKIQKNASFWLDNKTLKNVKPCTIYKVLYKKFEDGDVRLMYPNCFCLIKMKEVKKTNSTIANLFDNFMKQERSLIDNERRKTAERIMMQDKARSESPQKQIKKTFKYKNTPFEVEISDVSDFEYDEDKDEFVDEAKIIQKFAKQQDKIIEIALVSAAKNELETARDWTENPNLTKEEFIENLLVEPFHIFIDGENSFTIDFETNGMFTDHCLTCSITNEKCTSTSIEG